MTYKSDAVERTTDVRRPVVPPSLLRKSVDSEPSGRELRKRVGNIGIQRLVGAKAESMEVQAHAPTTETRLTVSTPGDAHEREADRVADHVMRMSSTDASANVKRQCADCEEDSKGVATQNVHRKEQSATASTVTPAVAANINALRGGGSALPAASRAFFEPRFGAEFGGVRVHTDARADEAARAIDAKAFTVGNDIAFRSGEYSPSSYAGQKLLAHELTHVVQQDGDYLQQVPMSPKEVAFAGKAPSERGTRPLLGLITRKAEKQPADDGQRSFTIAVKWYGDAGDFFSAVVTAIARKTGIPESALFQPCYVPAHRVHSAIELEAGSRRMRSVRIDVALGYNSRVFPSVNGLTLAAAAEMPATNPEATKRQPPATQANEAIPPKETPAQRLNRQAKTSVRVLSGVVSDADREGYTSVVITIDHSADEVSFDFEKRGPKTDRQSGTMPVSADTLAREHIKPLVDIALMGEGSYRVEFARSAEGRLEFIRAQRMAKAPPPGPGKTEREMLDEMGIPDRKKIYAGIFKETERQLKEAGVMVATFTIEQLVLYIAGGLLLRGLGLLGRAAARGFPHLLRALQLGQRATVGRALGTLVEAEASEFAALMSRVEKGGSLSKTELTRLSELATKVETAIASDVPSLRVIGRIKESARLVKEAESIGEAAQREVDALLQQYLAGNANPGIGTKVLSGDIKYLRGRNGGRLFFRENADGYIEILGKADKGNESAVIDTLLKTFQ